MDSSDIHLMRAVEYIKENLSIEIWQEEDFGPIQKINVKLFLGEEEISEDTCHLPYPSEFE